MRRWRCSATSRSRSIRRRCGRSIARAIRSQLVERYLTRNHPLWLEGKPTPSFYRPRLLEGRASGVAIPLGEISRRDRLTIQPLPDGIVVQGRNAHFGGRSETISFDIIARDLDDAITLGRAAGRQHTLPGSAGATSGTTDAMQQIALLWEIQPNVYKPAGDRNREISKLYRRHRNWHVITLATAIEWLRAKSFRVFIVRGEALPATHEVNAGTLSPSIIALHNRTVSTVATRARSRSLPATRDDEQLLANSTVMNTGLQKHVAERGASGAVWRVGVSVSPSAQREERWRPRRLEDCLAASQQDRASPDNPSRAKRRFVTSPICDFGGLAARRSQSSRRDASAPAASG